MLDPWGRMHRPSLREYQSRAPDKATLSWVKEQGQRRSRIYVPSYAWPAARQVSTQHQLSSSASTYFLKA